MEPEGKRQLAVGVDLGGTKIAAGVFDSSGSRRGEPVWAPTEAEGPGDGTVQNLLQVIERALASAKIGPHDVCGIGVGSTGPLDPQRGKLLEAESLPNLYHFGLREAIQSRFPLPVPMTNDGNAFALGEALHGAGKGHGIVVGVTLGTGCGCGIVIHGKILEGATANSGEVYRAPVAGRSFDEALSGRGLQRIYREKSGREARGKEITQLAEERDAAALESLDDFGRQVGQGLGIIASVIDPHVMVVGGSVAEAFPYFSGALRAEIMHYVAPSASRSLHVLPAKLGTIAGVMGAAALVFSGETIR